MPKRVSLQIATIFCLDGWTGSIGMGTVESLKYVCFLPTNCPVVNIPGEKEDQMVQGRYVFPFSQLRMTDVDRVGGKNASLGELLSQLTDAGIRVPDGFATTAFVCS